MGERADQSRAGKYAVSEPRKTAFYEVGLQHGAKMIEMFGYLLPWEFSTGQEAEHLGTRHAASLCDLDYMGEFSIEGPGAMALVQRLATNDFSSKPTGSIGYTAICDQSGLMVDDGTVWRLDDRKFMLVTGDEQDFVWLEENAKDFDVTINNITAEHTTLALQGPRSPEVLRRLTSFALNTLQYYHFGRASVGGVDCLVARMGYTGEFGYELHFHPKSAARLWGEIMSVGSDVGIVPLGQAALESLRQEAGYLLVGNDHDKSTNPLEAGIAFTVKFEKPDFNGKSALIEIALQGVRRRMVWFDVPSGAIAEKGDSVLLRGKRIGYVTSGSYSPSRKRGTAMGYVNPEHSIPGLNVQLERKGRGSDATLFVMPLYDPGDQLSRPLRPR